MPSLSCGQNLAVWLPDESVFKRHFFCFYGIYCWLLSESDYSKAQFHKINWIFCWLTRLFFWSRELNAVPTCPVDKETIKMHEVSGYSFISAVSIFTGRARQLRKRWLLVLRAQQFFCLWNDAEGSSELSGALSERNYGCLAKASFYTSCSKVISFYSSVFPVKCWRISQSFKSSQVTRSLVFYGDFIDLLF